MGGEDIESAREEAACEWCRAVCTLHVHSLHTLTPPRLTLTHTNKNTNAGDIADTAAAIAATFRLLSARFWRVVWVPGNHGLWLRPDTPDRTTYPDSWAKVMALRQVCAGTELWGLNRNAGGWLNRLKHTGRSLLVLATGAHFFVGFNLNIIMVL